MSLVNGAVDSLLDGVSQEPPSQRLPSQATEQINGWSSRTFGLLKRPPTHLVKKMVSATPPSAYAAAVAHTIKRTPTDVHKVIVKNGGIEIFDATNGNAVSITASSDTAYLATAQPNKDIRLITVGDTTFVLNRAVPVKKATTRSAALDNRQALIFIRSVDYSTQYSVHISKVGGGGFALPPAYDPNARFNADAYVSYTTPAGDTPLARAQISTDFVAKNLFNQLKSETFKDTGALLTTVYSFALINSTIIVTRTIDNYDFGLAVTDGLADTAIGCIKHAVADKGDLPVVAPDGYRVQILGDPLSPYDDYWVKYNSQVTVQGAGVWQETVAPGVETDLDATTMPHILVETPVREFFFKDGGVAPLINVENYYGAEQVEQWVSLGQNQNLVITAQDAVGTALFANTSGYKNKDCLTKIVYDIDTSHLAVDDSVTVYLEKETAAGAGTYTVVSSKIYLPGSKFVNEAQTGIMRPTNTTTFHGRIRMHYNNSAGGTATLTGHSRYQAGGPGFSYKMILGSLISTNYDIWPGSNGSIEAASLSVDDPNVGNLVYVQIFQYDDTKAAAQLKEMMSGSPAGAHNLVYKMNALGGFNVTATQLTVNSWLLTWASQSANDGIPIVTATRTPNYQATGSGTGRVSLFDPTFAAIAKIPVGYMSPTIKNMRTGETITSQASNACSISLASGSYSIPVAVGDIYRVSSIASFTFGPAVWTSRDVGDDTTNPFPSFVNRQLQDVFSTQGRIGFVADNNVILSNTKDVFKFFRESATQLVASDLIDVKSASVKPAFFHSAVEWDNKLYLFTDLQVFEMKGNPFLSPETISMQMVLDVESSRYCRPFSAGRRLFIARPRSDSANLSQVLELGHAPNGDGLMFDTVTSHLPTYLAGAPLALCGDDGAGALFLFSDTGAFYPHFYDYDERGVKSMNSWSTWTFPSATLLGADMANGVLSLVTTRSDGVYLETIDLNSAPGTSTVHKDIGSVAYPFTYTLSTIFARKVMRDYTVKLDKLAKLQIRYVNMRYENSRSFTMTATNPGRATYASVFSSSTPADGSFNFAVLGKNTDLGITLSDTSDYPCRFSGFDWEATYSIRSQRL